MTRQRIDDQDLSDLNEVVQNTPGLTLHRTAPERSTYYARGVALDNVMYDGLPTSLDSSQTSQDLLSPTWRSMIESRSCVAPPV